MTLYRATIAGLITRAEHATKPQHAQQPSTCAVKHGHTVALKSLTTFTLRMFQKPAPLLVNRVIRQPEESTCISPWNAKRAGQSTQLAKRTENRWF
jgi:hypothetical protein